MSNSAAFVVVSVVLGVLVLGCASKREPATNQDYKTITGTVYSDDAMQLAPGATLRVELRELYGESDHRGVVVAGQAIKGPHSLPVTFAVPYDWTRHAKGTRVLRARIVENGVNTFTSDSEYDYSGSKPVRIRVFPVRG
jgi:uncharacterized lipoprotein YbaY